MFQLNHPTIKNQVLTWSRDLTWFSVFLLLQAGVNTDCVWDPAQSEDDVDYMFVDYVRDYCSERIRLMFDVAFGLSLRRENPFVGESYSDYFPDRRATWRSHLYRPDKEDDVKRYFTSNTFGFKMVNENRHWTVCKEREDLGQVGFRESQQWEKKAIVEKGYDEKLEAF